jgi:single-stranded-DNA-specific exonuclease
MNKRILRRAIENQDGLLTLHPLLQRLFSGRDIKHTDEIDYSLSKLLPYDGLLNIEKAAERIAGSIEKQDKMIVVGDFDADGATSSALICKTLQMFGAQHIQYLIPNRFDFGYGLTPEIVDIALVQEPNLIITVDNGIASHAGVDKANAAGVDVIITDHHLPGNTLPNAAVIVNPNQPGDTFASKNLAGVGVAFYVMLALRAKLKSLGWFEKNNIPYPKMVGVLDYVALGTIADVVHLDQNNRTLVRQGLRRIRAGLASPGILALIKAARRDFSKLKASDLAYGLAPRLNAVGRLDDMSFGVACLLEEDFNNAFTMATRLNALNDERREIEAQMQEDAFHILNGMDFSTDNNLGVCVYDPKWHQGVIGLLASRLKEKLHRPIIVFSKANDTELKGSARSVKGIHIRDLLDRIATENPGLIDKFGGHAMAAGLSLSAENYEAFQTAFNQTIEAIIQPNQLQNIIETDGELIHSDFTLENAKTIREAGPWGQGFPEPLFDGVFRLIDHRIVGERHLKMTLQPKDGSIYLDGIAFNVDLDTWPNHNCEFVYLIYHLDVNYFRGRQRLQILAEDLFSGIPEDLFVNETPEVLCVEAI